MKKNKTLVLNIANLFLNILYLVLIISLSIFLFLSLKLSAILIIIIFPIIGLAAMILFYMKSYKQKEINSINIILFICGMNFISLLLSYIIIEDLKEVKELKLEKENNDFDKHLLLPAWEKEILAEKNANKINQIKKTKKEINQQELKEIRDIYKSYSRYVYNFVLANNTSERNTFKLITLTSEMISDKKLINEFLSKKDNFIYIDSKTKEEVKNILINSDPNEIIITFKEQRTTFE